MASAPIVLFTVSFRSTRLCTSSERPVREYERSPSISACIRSVPSTMNADEFVRGLVELALIALLQELDEAGDRPQWLGEIVRGDVGELLELVVCVLELGRVARRAPRRGA